MFRLFNIRRLLVAGVVALGMSFGMSSTADAGGYCHVGGCYYKQVVVYETRLVPYTYHVTLYDHCGYPYQVQQTAYKTVAYPVVKLVKVY
jgi:hypothetical protein